MANKFRGLEPLEPGQEPAKPVQMGLAGGYRGDVSPRQIPPNSSPELSDVRFERSAIRRDFGWQAVGAAATGVIRAILEHKYIDANQTFHRLIRIFIDGGGNAALEVWDGANWVLTDTSTEQVNDVYLSALSALGCAYFADGQQVLEWCEVLQKIPQENDFPNGNLMDSAGAQIDATVTPASAEVLQYEINYDVTVNSSPTQDTIITLGFYHGLVKLGEATIVVDQLETFPFSSDNRIFQFERQIDDMDIVSIKVESAEGGGTTFELDNVVSAGPGPPDLIGDKTPQTQPAVDNKYRYFFEASGVGGGTTYGFWYNNGSGWNLASTKIVNADGPDDQIVTIPGLIDPAAMFGFSVVAGPGALGDTQVGWTRSNADFSVHGHNKADQGDDPAGVTYETTGAVVSQFQKVDPGPGGRFLFFFARRVVVLRSFGDTQALTWSQDGVVVFEGEGSGEIVLVEARSDPVDDLMGAAVVNSNFAALFRKRSIWRVFETQITSPALGAVGWIEDLGTNSPFSIKNVRGGVMFLGHDMMVYFLTEGGPTPVGEPIHQDLIEELTEDLDLVDSGWDPTFQEYYLGVPTGTGIIERVWIFDVQKYLDRQEIVWRKRPMTVQRFSARGVSEVE